MIRAFIGDLALTGIRLYLWAEGCEGHRIPELSYIYGRGEFPAVNKHIQILCSPNPPSITIVGEDGCDFNCDPIPS